MEDLFEDIFTHRTIRTSDWHVRPRTKTKKKKPTQIAKDILVVGIDTDKIALNKTSLYRVYKYIYGKEKAKAKQLEDALEVVKIMLHDRNLGESVAMDSDPVLYELG